MKKALERKASKVIIAALAVFVMILSIMACMTITAYAEGGIVDMIRIVSMDTYDEHGYPMYYFKNAEKHGYRVDHAEEWLVQVQGRKAQYTANVYLVALDGYKFSLDDTLTNCDLSLNGYLMEVNDDGRTAVVFVAGARNSPSAKDDPLVDVQEVTERTGESLMVEPTIPAATATPKPVETPAPKYGFKKINGYWYYTDGVNYRKGFVTLDNGYVFYFDDDYRMHNGWLIIGEDTYYFGYEPNGVMFKNQFAEIDGVTYYFDQDGKMKTGWLVDSDRNAYFFATKEAEFVITTYDEFNRYSTEKVTLPKGAMLKNYWFVAQGNAYYLLSDGKLARDTFVGNHQMDPNGITPSNTLDFDEYHVYDESESFG